jgi:hypothetical protein
MTPTGRDRPAPNETVPQISPSANPSIALDEYLARKARIRKLREELQAARAAGKALRHARRLRQIAARERGES